VNKIKISKKIKYIEKDLKELKELRATYKHHKDQLLKGERILKQIYLKIVLFEKSVKKENQSPGLLKELKRSSLEHIKSSTYQDPEQKYKDIELVSKYYDLNYLKEGIRKRKKTAFELDHKLTELSDLNMRIRKRIRKYEKKIRKINQNLI